MIESISVEPAFPYDSDDGGVPGMNKREWFASMAMTVFANPTVYGNVVTVAEKRGELLSSVMAKYCVEFADAVLSQLEKP